jgi:hypothetical protein
MSICGIADCRDVVRYGKGYTMEDWMAFTECFSVYLTHNNLLGTTFSKMWGLLRRAVVFCFRAGESHFPLFNHDNQLLAQ